MAAAALLAALASCRGDGDDGVTGPTVPPGDETTTTTAGPSTTTSAAPENYEVPEVIDQAYVQRVVSAYDKVLGDAIRVLKRDGQVTDEFRKYLVGLYTSDEFEFQQNFWLEGVDKGVLSKYRDPPGDPVTTIVRLVRADRTCLIAQVDQSYAEVLRPGEDPAATAQDDYIVLVPKSAGRDPLVLNATPWATSFSGYKQDNSEPVDECAE